jgi:hypothetical protein
MERRLTLAPELPGKWNKLACLYSMRGWEISGNDLAAALMPHMVQCSLWCGWSMYAPEQRAIRDASLPFL